MKNALEPLPTTTTLEECPCCHLMVTVWHYPDGRRAVIAHFKEYPKACTCTCLVK